MPWLWMVESTAVLQHMNYIPALGTFGVCRRLRPIPFIPIQKQSCGAWPATTINFEQHSGPTQLTTPHNARTVSHDGCSTLQNVE